MSKWHRVELDSDQMRKMIDEMSWGALDEKNWNDKNVSERRVKIRRFRTIVGVDGELKKTSFVYAGVFPAGYLNDTTWVYKFKDEIEAFAFKLEWS